MTSTSGASTTVPTVSTTPTELTATAVFSAIYPPENIEKFDAMGPGDLFQWNAISDLVDSFEGEDKLKILNVIAEKMDEIKSIGKDLERVNFDSWRYESLTLSPEKMFKVQLDSTRSARVAWDVDKLEISTANERLARETQIISSLLIQETNLLDADPSLVSEFDIKFGLNGNPDNVAQIVAKNIRFNGIDYTDVSLTEPITKIMFALSPELTILTESVSTTPGPYTDPRLKAKEQYNGIMAYDTLGSAGKRVLKHNDPLEGITWRDVLQKSASDPRSIPRFQYQIEFKEWARIVERIREDIGLSIYIKELSSLKLIHVDDTESAKILLIQTVNRINDYVNTVASLTNVITAPTNLEKSTPWSFYVWIETNLIRIFNGLFPTGPLTPLNQSYYSDNEKIRKGILSKGVRGSTTEIKACVDGIKEDVQKICDTIKNEYKNGDPLKSWDHDKPTPISKYTFPKLGDFYKSIQAQEIKFQEGRSVGKRVTNEISLTIAMIVGLTLNGVTKGRRIAFTSVPKPEIGSPFISVPSTYNLGNVFVKLRKTDKTESWSTTDSWELLVEFNTTPHNTSLSGSQLPQFTYWLLFNGINVIPSAMKDLVMRFDKTDLNTEIDGNLK